MTLHSALHPTLQARLHVLKPGVHVLPVFRADGAFLLVAVDENGQAIGDPEWVPLDQLGDRAEQLKEQLLLVSNLPAIETFGLPQLLPVHLPKPGSA